jgi:RNA polymerase sigma factor (sigma-70 family)
LTSTPASIEHLLRELAPQVLGAVARRHGDFADAEDAVQEALIAAAEQWPRDGIPGNPRGWLYSVALRRMTDHLRSEMSRKKREDSVAADFYAEWAFIPSPDSDLAVDDDDTLILLFMSCHPALSISSQIALTLRAVGGLTTAEIAAAFLVPEATMAQRISRAKSSIKSSGVAFELPSRTERDQRVAAVMHTLYLIFNEGYTSTSGDDLNRPDLSSEAIRLARMLLRAMPDDAEVRGLLALMLLTDARRGARTGPAGELIPLDEQDRSLWDRGLIEEGVRLTDADPAGPYAIQAAIAAEHDRATTVEDTDWRRILGLYGALRESSDNPMIALSYAVAASMVDGPARGLALVEALANDPRIAGHYRLHAVRAHLYERAGNSEQARGHFLAAADGTTSTPERNYLIVKAQRLKANTRNDNEHNRRGA